MAFITPCPGTRSAPCHFGQVSAVWTILCPVGCLAAPQASNYETPVACPSPPTQGNKKRLQGRMSSEGQGAKVSTFENIDPDPYKLIQHPLFRAWNALSHSAGQSFTEQPLPPPSNKSQAPRRLGGSVG